MRPVEALLVNIEDGVVRLKKKDGTVLEVPVDKLSEKDIAFVKRHVGVLRTSGIASASELEKLANEERTAANALTLYHLFLKDPFIPKREKAAAQRRLAYWEDAAKKQMIRVGQKWRLPDEVLAMEAKEAALIKEAETLLKLENFELALERFGEAS